MDGAVDISLDYALHLRDAAVFHGEHRRKDGGRYTACEFHGAARLGTVAYHARKICDHVLDSHDDLLIPAAHEVGYAAARSRCRDDTSAQGREASEALFDVYDGQVAQCQCAYHLLVRGAALLTVDNDWESCRYALIAAP